MPPRLMLGTRNRKKRKEIVEILGDLGLEFGDLADRPRRARRRRDRHDVRGQRPPEGRRRSPRPPASGRWARTAAWSCRG